MAYSAEAIKKISRATSNFYNEAFSSFSETRKNAWDGWDKVAQICEFSKFKTLNLIDVGCGNLRFEKFVNDNFSQIKIECNAYDNCKNLVQTNSLESGNLHVNFTPINIIEELLDDSFALKEASDLCVAFGLMHHIPTYELRRKFIQVCLNSVSNGGYLVLSFWQFANDAKLLQKAKNATSSATKVLEIEKLEPNDYFLQWQDRDDIFRYCHNFSNTEIDQLCKIPGAVPIAQFREDGKNHNLNKYVILQNIDN